MTSRRNATVTAAGHEVADRLVVTFVCPQCCAEVDRALRPGLRPRPFPCPTRPCGHVFSPPRDFWEHALGVLQPPPPPRLKPIRRPLPLASEEVLRVAAAATAPRQRRAPTLSLVQSGPYTLQLEWPADGHVGTLPSHALEAETLEQAKFQAAIRYAGASFQAVPPNAYRILGPTGETLYRYPEPRPRA